jgi:putative sterol carrier protein
MPELGSEAWVDAFNAAVCDLDPGSLELSVLHTVDGGPAWLITVADGTVGVDQADPDDDADLTFHWQHDDAVAVARGEHGPLVAFQAGRLKVGGDLTRLTEAAELFARFPPVPSA